MSCRVCKRGRSAQPLVYRLIAPLSTLRGLRKESNPGEIALRLGWLMLERIKPRRWLRWRAGGCRRRTKPQPPRLHE
jgi:hypothetical protein